MAAFELQTARLTLRHFATDDAPFILALLNEREFVEFIGDKRVRNLEDARRYIEEGALKSYREQGFGPYVVQLRATGEPLGMCGLYQRPGLALPDLGFALHRAQVGQGYAEEASRAVIGFAGRELRLRELAAIVDAGNERSIRLLDRLGFRFRCMYRLPDETDALRCYVCGTGCGSGTLLPDV